MKQARKKSGNLSSGSKEPPFRGGLDWEAIRHGNRPREEWGEPLPEKLQLDIQDIDRRNRGYNTYYGPDREEQKKEARKKGGRRTRPAPFDVDELVRLYVDEKKTVNELALILNSAPQTIRNHLKKREVYDPSRDKHKPVRPPESYKKNDRCVRDHDLTLPGATREAPLKPGKDGKMVRNGRVCVECKREADRSSYNWDEDPRNPKNGGNSSWTPERKERERLKRARERLACPNEKCGHQGVKHELGCRVRDCRCTYTISDIKGLWAQIGAEG